MSYPRPDFDEVAAHAQRLGITLEQAEEDLMMRAESVAEYMTAEEE